MHVGDHEPAAWFLLDHDGELLLDVNCSWSAFSYSVTIALDDDERERHAADGHAYLDELATAVQQSAPGIRGHESPYTDRNLAAQHGEAVTAAVVRWREANPDR